MAMTMDVKKLIFKNDFATFALLWLALVLPFVALSAVFGWGPNGWYNNWLLGIGQEWSKYGVMNIWTPYSQTTNLLFYGMYLITGGNAVLFWLLFIVVNLISYLAIIFCIYSIAKKIYGRTYAKRVTFILIILCTFMFYAYGNTTYDAIPVAIMILSIYFLFHERYISSAFVAGFGGGIKIFPLVGFLMLLKQLYHKQKVKLMLKCLGACLLGLAPLFVFLATNPPMFASGYLWQAGAPTNETVYSFSLWLANVSPNADPRFYTDLSGTVPDSYLKVGITPSPTIMHSSVSLPPTSVAMFVPTLVMLVVLLSILYVFFRVKHFDKRGIFILTLFILAPFLASTKQWSPQYFLWIMPLMLLWKPQRAGQILTIGLTLLVLLGFPVSHWLYSTTGLQFFAGVFWVSVVLRTIILAAISLFVYFGDIRGKNKWKLEKLKIVHLTS